MPTSKLLELLGVPLRRAILRHYTVNSCVASSAIGLTVLDRIGIEVRPLSVKALIANAAFVSRAEKEGRVPVDRAETERWYEQYGAHGIGLGIPEPEPTEIDPITNGLHLVLLVENRYLWDLSIDQASRPEHSIVITQPFLGDAGVSPKYKKWVLGREQIMWEAPGQGMILYSVKPGDLRYLEHPNWRSDSRDAPKREAIATEALTALRGLFELGRLSGELTA